MNENSKKDKNNEDEVMFLYPEKDYVGNKYGVLKYKTRDAILYYDKKIERLTVKRKNHEWQ